MNAVAEALTGWPRSRRPASPWRWSSNIVNEDTRAPVHSPGRAGLREAWWSAWPTTPACSPRRHRAADRRQRRAHPRRPGPAIGAVLVFRDISARRAAEAALRASDERFTRLVTATAADHLDRQRARRVRRAAAVVGGLHRPKLGRLPRHGLARRGAPRRPGGGGRRMAQGRGQPGAVPGPRPGVERQDEEYCHFEARAAVLLNGDGTPREWIGTVLDVNDRELARSQARESEGRFRILADSAPVLMWMTKRRRRLRVRQPAWLEFTGRSMEQELGLGWLDSLHPDDAAPPWPPSGRPWPSAGPTRLSSACAGTTGCSAGWREAACRALEPMGLPRFYRLVPGYPFAARGGRGAGPPRPAAGGGGRIGQRALAGLPLPQLMDEVVQTVSRTLGVEYTKLLKLLPSGQRLLLAAGVGWQPGLVGSAIIGAGKEFAGGLHAAAEPASGGGRFGE